ncbi:MAG: hypothetical protein IVW57_00550 [Ktedonobacterales bacterium]|nr:hypothetical protein [Ktedonobacterales bacterium]
MTSHQIAHMPSGAEVSARRRGRARLSLALPLLLVLVALVAMPGIALAGGTPPSVNLAVDPASGPVGAQVTVKGSSFTPGDAIQIGYATGSCANGVTIISGATGTATSGGTVSIIIVWPSSGTGNYIICAKDTTNGHTYPSANHFQVTSATAPAIAISSPVRSGQPVTVTGSNFLVPGGGTVEIRYGPGSGNGCATTAGTATLNADGSFTFTFNAPFEASSTQITITAVYPQGSCDGSWVLRASKTVTVLAATATTPSPTVKPTVAPGVTPGTTPAPVSIVFPPTFPPTPAETVVYCLVGLLLLLLLLLLFLLLARRRRKDQPVMIQQKDTPVVNSGQGGSPMVQSSIYAENPRNQRRTQIAEEVTTIQEEPVNPPNPPGGGGPAPRYGPALGGE